jgi:hypothetical protein
MELTNKIDKAIEFIAQAHAELKAGNLTLLKDFEDMVRDIQKDIISKAPENPGLNATKLATLANALRDFEVDLRALQIDVKYELMSLNQKQQAVKAYQTVKHSTPDTQDDKK